MSAPIVTEKKDFALRLALRTAAVAGTIVLATGCESRLYQRSAVVLDIPDHDQLQVHYGEFDGCLLRQQIPLDYRVKRPRYTLKFDTGFGAEDYAPKLSLELSDAPDAEATFPNLDPAPPSAEGDGVIRYRIDTQKVGDHLSIDIRRGGESLGTESIGVRTEHCKAMALSKKQEP